MPYLALDQHVHDSWQVEDGLPQNTVNAITQTADGYLWMGTQGGLARFDGTRFTVFAKDSTRALRSGQVLTLRRGRSDTLQIGLRSGGVAQYAGGAFALAAYADSLSGAIVRALHEGTRGRTWIGTQSEGLYLAAGDSLARRYTRREGLSGDAVLALAGGAGGGPLWIGTEAGLTRLEGGQLASFTRGEDGLPGRQVKALAQGPSDTLWVGTEQGLAYRPPGREARFSVLPLPADRCGRNVSALHKGARGALWIGTLDGGVCRYTGGRFDAFTTADGLTHHRVRSLFQDREGSLWIGTEMGGLNRLRAAKFAPISTEQGLPSDMVFTVMEGPDASLWIGTDGGGLSRRRPDGTITTYTEADGLSSGQVAALARGRDSSTVWAGTLGGGLCRYARGQISCAPAGGRLSGENVYALEVDRQGRLWAGTDEGLARIGPGGGAFKRFTAKDSLSARDSLSATDSLSAGSGLSSNLITSIIEGQRGALWVGTMGGGLNRLSSGGKVTHYGAEEGLSGQQVLTLYQDSAGTLWVGTFDGGLCRMAAGGGNAPDCFTHKDGLSENILHIQEDDRGFLWLGTLNGGILRVRKRVLAAYAAGERDDLPHETYGVGDGVPARELNGGTQPASWRGSDGRLYFATIGGVAVVDPVRLRRNTVPPLVEVERMRARGKPVALDTAGGPVELPAPKRDLAIHYAGLSFAEPEEVTFEYRLVGYDREWVPAGTRREAFYTNLAPGAYRFEVRAQNNDGVWSEQAATLSFRVAPFFYETWWFYALCALAVGLAATGGYRWRIWHVRARERRLEGVVDERTSDLRAREHELRKVNAQLAQANSDLATLNADLEDEVQAQVEQKIAERHRYEKELIAAKEKAEKSAQLKSTILQNMSHEIRTPISSILGFAEILAEEVSDHHHQEFVGYIERHGQRLLETLNSILDLSRIEVDGAELHLERFDLAEHVRGAVGILEPTARQKELALRTECPDGPLPVHLDKGAIDRIVHNLVGNAIKFTETGEVVARVEPLACATEGGEAPRGNALPGEEALPEDAALPGGAVRLTVRDTGSGIGEDFRPHLFEAFRQESDGLDRFHEGTGLGLSITLHLVEEMGGTISVESEPGEGTTFRVHLPRDASQSPAPSDGASSENASSESVPSENTPLPEGRTPRGDGAAKPAASEPAASEETVL